MDHAFELISTYGYGALFGLLVLGIVGLPVPDEALLTLVGYLCFKGELQVGAALLTAWLGTSCGITISYGLGRVIGLRAIGRLGLLLHFDSDDIIHAQTWLQHWGPYALPLAYFIPGVRHLAALLTGVSGLPLIRFAPFAYAGAFLWCGTFISIGYGLGAEWSRLSPSIHRAVVLLALGVITGIAITLVFWRRQQGARGRSPH
jgi:membrane protein DedA with SNARE-associated domain